MLNDVGTEWWGGGTQKAEKGTDELRERDSDRGSKNPKSLRTSFRYGPKTNLKIICYTRSPRVHLPSESALVTAANSGLL